MRIIYSENTPWKKDSSAVCSSSPNFFLRRYRLFEQWFFDCWKEAKAQTSVMMDAYFSIHDTYFRTDLNTLKTINEDEIAQRYL
ncbi:hypothetical protein [Chryseobacterium arthrosphaerae]|uniref:hypothetical protein n=1 Tax=Chryseobacterium arthrosphaerae TaxID=651561 RepID=UPI00242039FF|nr:hypothetical protein [Chryseobacterium arthrosphaerae]